jgi:hypothetical protein
MLSIAHLRSLSLEEKCIGSSDRTFVYQLQSLAHKTENRLITKTKDIHRTFSFSFKT